MAQRSEIPVLAAGDMFHNPAVNTIATKTLAAPTGDKHWCVTGVLFGYDIAPATATLFTIESPAATVHIGLKVLTAGIQNVDFVPPLEFPAGLAVVIALAAGGATQSGYVAFKGAYIA